MSSKNRKKRVKKLTAGKVIGRIFIVLGTTLLAALVFVLAVVFILTKGPSKQACKLFTLSAYETSAIKWVPKIFLSEEEYNDIINLTSDNSSDKNESYKELPTAKLTDAADEETFENADLGSYAEPIEIVDIKGSTFQGKLMMVHDPSKVQFVSLDSFGGRGLVLSEFINKYDGIGGTNAGGFMDEGGQGNGGTPDGMVIRDGKIIYGSSSGFYRGFAGFDANGILHVGDMTGQQALDEGIVNGSNYANGSVLIKDGVVADGLVSGINPRTCIGQTEDGTVLLLAVEGRLADSLGATLEDLAEVLQEYGAVNAVNLDGGSSSGMYYEGERITKSCSVIGDRPIPTAVVVLR